MQKAILLLPLTKTARGFNCSIRYILDQNNSENILKYISSIFNGGSVYHRKATKDVYRLEVRNISSIKIIYNYFTHFPLKTIKVQSFSK